MKLFAKIVNSFQLLTIFVKSPIMLDVSQGLNASLSPIVKCPSFLLTSVKEACKVFMQYIKHFSWTTARSYTQNFFSILFRFKRAISFDMGKDYPSFATTI